MNVIPCASCIHFERERRDGEFCAAFPGGIPEEITSGANQHRGPFPGDNGIRWAPVEGLEFLDVPMPEGTERQPSKGEVR